MNIQTVVSENSFGKRIVSSGCKDVFFRFSPSDLVQMIVLDLDPGEEEPGLASEEEEPGLASGEGGLAPGEGGLVSEEVDPRYSGQKHSS
jgi:hypothetical protein